ncbi:MAG: TIGR01906 family membrane protein [Eubacterium sp.]|nr:TIGR01906 family membrane protein [Eubacterium sp.]
MTANCSKKNTVFNLITGMILSLFIISAAVTIALNFRFIYYADIDRYGLTQVSGLTKDELIQDYNTLIDYNCIWGGSDKLEFAHFTLSDSAVQHFREARTLFLFFGWGVIVFGIASAIMILIARRKKLGVSFLKYAAIITIVLPIILGVFAAIAWDRFFVLFHELSFGNDLWLFDPAVDPIINVLPSEFFFHEAMAIFGLVILGGMICAAIYISTVRSRTFSK